MLMPWVKVPLPSGVAPSKKVTKPTGLGVPPDGVTVAVNITVSPSVIVPAEAETVVFVAVWAFTHSALARIRAKMNEIRRQQAF